MWKKALAYASVILFMGCAGMSRKCSSCTAGYVGADWLVVQYTNDGRVMKCWKLTRVSMVNEEASDGVYWEGSDGNLIHISGWYNRVQVSGDRWKAAAAHLGIVDQSACLN